MSAAGQKQALKRTKILACERLLSDNNKWQYRSYRVTTHACVDTNRPIDLANRNVTNETPATHKVFVPRRSLWQLVTCAIA